MGILPSYFLVVFITIRLFPPGAETTGDYRGILYGAHRGTDEPPALESPSGDGIETDMPTPAPVDIKLPSRMFMEVPVHRSLEGVVLRIATILLIVFLAWMATRPLIYRILPEFGATRRGPAGFPMTVHIGQDALRFTNGSSELWTCEAHLGFSERHTITFGVEPQKSRDISYGELQALAGNVDVPFFRRAAREKIELKCTEPSGVTHSRTFD